jgi:hypothetical protein
MAITCALCNKHIAPMSAGGERWLCAECIKAGHRLPEWDDEDGDE